MSDERDFKLGKPLGEKMIVYLVIERTENYGVEDVVAIYMSRYKAKAESERRSMGDCNKHYVQTHKVIM